MINARLLEHAICKGFYVYEDYSKNPVKYGNVNIQHNILGGENIRKNFSCEKVQGKKMSILEYQGWKNGLS